MNIDGRGRSGPFAWPAAIGVSVSTLLLIVLVVAWLQRDWEEHRAERIQRAAALTTAITRHVDAVLSAIEGDLRGLADLIRHNPGMLRLGDEGLDRHLRSMKQWNVSIGAINVFDADGLFVGTSVAGGRLGVRLDSPRLRAYAVERSRDSTVSPPIRSDLLGAEVFSVTIGVYGEAGEFLGMVGALLPTAQFLDLFLALKPDTQSAVMLMRGNGVDLVRQVDPGSAIAARLAEEGTRAALARDARDRRTGILEPSSDIDLLRIVSRLERFDLYATTAIDVAALRSGWLEHMRATLLAFLVLALGSVALNVAIVVHLLRRARETARLQRRDAQRFRDGVEAMADAFALWDSDDRLALWNQRYVEIFPKLRPHLRVGLPYRKLLEVAAREEWPERDADEVERIVVDRLRWRGRRERTDFVMADGRIISTTERRTAEGGVVCLFQDVTEERRVAAQLEASNALFRDGIEAMHDGFVLLDSRECIVAWNDAFLRMAPRMAPVMKEGAAVRDTVRFSVELLRDTTPDIDVEAEVARRLDTYRRAATIEMVTAGTSRNILATARRTSAGGMLLIYRDVTEIRAAEVKVKETLTRLQAALETERETNAQHRRFVSMASHEFRTPLAIIDSASQRIEVAVAGNAAAAKRLGRIRGAVARMTEIIDRTLSSTRLDDGRIAAAPARFDLVQVVRESAGRQQSISPDFAITVTCEPSQLEIVADRGMIEQVCVNLLSNAIKYSGASRSVEVTLERDATHATISVRDHGLGIAESEIAMLFTRYFRASTAMGISGTGIGLHLVKELVTLHDGEVSVESALGKGSVFRVRLPLEQTVRAAAAAVAA